MIKTVVPLGKIQLLPLEPFHGIYRFDLKKEIDQHNRFFFTNTDNHKIEINDKFILGLYGCYSNDINFKTIRYKPNLGVYKINKNGNLVSSNITKLNMLKNIDLTKTITLKEALYSINSNDLYDQPTINIYGIIHNNNLLFTTQTEPLSLNKLWTSTTLNTTDKPGDNKLKVSKIIDIQKFTLRFDLKIKKEVHILLKTLQYEKIFSFDHGFCFDDMTSWIEICVERPINDTKFKEEIVLPLMQIGLAKISKPNTYVSISVGKSFKILF